MYNTAIQTFMHDFGHCNFCSMHAHGQHCYALLLIICVYMDTGFMHGLYNPLLMLLVMCNVSIIMILY